MVSASPFGSSLMSSFFPLTRSHFHAPTPPRLSLRAPCVLDAPQHKSDSSALGGRMGHGRAASLRLFLEPNSSNSSPADGSLTRPARSADPGRRILSSSTASALTAILEKVVTAGTGKAAAIPGYTVAGKTGTAQKIDESGRYARGRYVASFAGFVPSRNPALAIIVVVDEPHGGFHGGEIAAPAFARIALPALQYLGVMPEDGGVVLNRNTEIQAALKGFESMRTLPRGPFTARPGTAEQPAHFVPLALNEVRQRSARQSEETAEMPDLSGRSLREANFVMAQMGLICKIGGQGPVVGNQDPPPGAEVTAGSACQLVLVEERQ